MQGLVVGTQCPVVLAVVDKRIIGTVRLAIMHIKLLHLVAVKLNQLEGASAKCVGLEEEAARKTVLPVPPQKRSTAKLLQLCQLARPKVTLVHVGADVGACVS